MAEESNDVLHVNGKTFDTDDLTYGERRDIRRIIRNELWDESVDGDFDWEEVTADDVNAVAILVFMRRENPAFTLAEALACKPEKVLSGPPTESKPSSGRRKASATSGSQS